MQAMNRLQRGIEVALDTLYVSRCLSAVQLALRGLDVADSRWGGSSNGEERLDLRAALHDRLDVIEHLVEVTEHAVRDALRFLHT